MKRLLPFLILLLTIGFGCGKYPDDIKPKDEPKDSVKTDSTGFYATINDSTYLGKESHNLLYLTEDQINAFIRWKRLHLQLKFSNDRVLDIRFYDRGNWDAKNMVSKTYTVSGKTGESEGFFYGFYPPQGFWQLLYSSEIGGSGSITITKVDDDKKTISGYFSGDILNENGQTLHIKDGKFFNLKYYEDIIEN